MASTETAQPTTIPPGARVHRLPVPTPFAIGDVHAYLIEAERLTLVDSGPDAATSLQAIERQLAALGHTVADLDLLVITHPHVDHLGLTGILAERSGAAVAAYAGAAPVVEDFPARARDEDDYAAELMRLHGVSDAVIAALRHTAGLVRGWGASAHVDLPLADGDVLDLGDRALRVRFAPGHTPYDIVLRDDERGIELWGDHLIERVSSNALVTRPATGWDGTRPTPLLDYRRSLRATRDADVRLGLPGHGAPVADHRALIDRRLAEQDDRARRLLELVRERPRSGHELAQAIWGTVAFTQVYLTLSEVLGHLDILIEQGLVAEVTGDDGIVRFEPRGGADDR
jgi:glyoxylase-like metal-dependent hydrolase (beta-lactamase superfamily II)